LVYSYTDPLSRKILPIWPVGVPRGLVGVPLGLVGVPLGLVGVPLGLVGVPLGLVGVPREKVYIGIGNRQVVFFYPQ